MVAAEAWSLEVRARYIGLRSVSVVVRLHCKMMVVGRCQMRVRRNVRRRLCRRTTSCDMLKQRLRRSQSVRLVLDC